jgi:hypothetical protein
MTSPLGRSCRGVLKSRNALGTAGMNAEHRRKLADVEDLADLLIEAA